MENNFDFIVLENGEQTTLADSAETTVAITTEKADDAVNVQFQGWEQFGKSFEYMGVGMLGIFIVTTILIMCISLLNKIKSDDVIEED